MRQLRSCDFCDADDALGVYEVVPDHLGGAAERRLVLCPDCRDRLDWVLEPLFDALDGDDSDASEGTGADVTLLGVSQSRASSRTTEPSNDGSTHQPRSTNDERDADSTDDRPDGADSGEVERDAEAATAGSDDDEQTPAPAGASTADRADDDTPPKYRQVMRFLGNRDLPIDRTEAESLASGAYDLDVGEAAAIIDVALERGLLVEEGGKLRPA